MTVRCKIYTSQKSRRLDVLECYMGILYYIYMYNIVCIMCIYIYRLHVYVGHIYKHSLSACIHRHRYKYRENCKQQIYVHSYIHTIQYNTRQDSDNTLYYMHAYKHTCTLAHMHTCIRACIHAYI